MPLRFERDFWLATVTFGAGATASAEDAFHFLGRLREFFPGADQMDWQMPALAGGAQAAAVIGGTRFEVGPGGTLSALPPDLITGQSRHGWSIQLSTRMLQVRHQQTIALAHRGVPPEAFPNRQVFTELLVRTVESLPPTLANFSKRAHLSSSYAAYSGDIFPSTWIAQALGRGHSTEYPPPDGAVGVIAHQEQEFETLLGRRYVWNDHDRVGNWFGANGMLAVNAAVVQTVDLRTAITEPATPNEPRATIDDMPVIPPRDVVTFFGQQIGIGRVVDRLRERLPEEDLLDE